VLERERESFFYRRGVKLLEGDISSGHHMLHEGVAGNKKDCWKDRMIEMIGSKNVAVRSSLVLVF
jgi:hypothetical protein